MCELNMPSSGRKTHDITSRKWNTYPKERESKKSWFNIGITTSLLGQIYFIKFPFNKRPFAQFLKILLSSPKRPKMNMAPKKHPYNWKGNHSSKSQFFGVPFLIFQGVIWLASRDHVRLTARTACRWRILTMDPQTRFSSQFWRLKKGAKAGGKIKT